MIIKLILLWLRLNPFFSEIYTWNYYSIFLNDSDNVSQMLPFTKQKLFTDLSAQAYSMLSFEVKVILYLIQTSPLCIHRMLATFCKCNYLKGGRDWWSLELHLSFQEETRRHLVTSVVTIPSDKFPILFPQVVISMLNSDSWSTLPWTVAVCGLLGRTLGPLLMWLLGEETKVKLKTFLSALSWAPAKTHHTKSTSWCCPNHIYSQWGFPNMWRTVYHYWTRKIKLGPCHPPIISQAQNYHKARQLRDLTACRKEEVSRCRQERTCIPRMDWATRICMLNL